MRRRKKTIRFKNNEKIGSFADISFDISHETNAGEENLHFETKVHYLEKGD